MNLYVLYFLLIDMNELNVFNENKIWSNLYLTLSKMLVTFLNFSEFYANSGNNTELVGVKE